MSDETDRFEIKGKRLQSNDFEITFPHSEKLNFQETGSLVWYPFEFQWQTVVEDIKKFHTREFELDISYLDDLGINRRNCQILQKNIKGLKLGRKFIDFDSTVWRVSGNFDLETSQR